MVLKAGLIRRRFHAYGLGAVSLGLCHPAGRRMLVLVFVAIMVFESDYRI